MVGCENVILMSEAGQDIRNGKVFYDKQQVGLGDYFTQSILSDRESLKVYAGVHIKVTDNIHRARSKRFPYAVYYRVINHSAYITAVP